MPFNEKEALLRQKRAWNPRAETVRDSLFLEHPDFFDAHDLVQVKYEMLRRVQHEGETVTQAVALFGFSRPAFYQAQAAWAAQGLTGLVPDRPGPRGPHKLSPSVVSAAYAAHVTHPEWNYRYLAEWVHQEFAITIHPRSLARALRDRNKR